MAKRLVYYISSQKQPLEWHMVCFNFRISGYNPGKIKDQPKLMTLTPKQKRFLRTQAHNLNPIVMTGSAGLTAAVLNEIDRADAGYLSSGRKTANCPALIL